jgi:hypothetical protein
MQKYTFTAYIHPVSGGDDYCITGWVLATSKTYARRDIRDIIKQEGSAILTDYIMEG